MGINRRILAIAGGALLLVLAGVAAVLATLDLNQFVAPVLARIKAVTGREVTVGGDVRFRFGLRPRIVADDVRLANAPWAKGPYLVTAKHLEMQVALLPLVRGQFELVRLNVVEPVITLETAADGRNNWDLGSAPRTAAPAAVEAKPGAFALGDLEVNRGELTYRDAAGGAETRVTIDEFSLRAPDRQSQVKTEFKGTVDGTVVSLSGNVGPIATLLDRGTPYPVSLKGEVADRKTAVAFTMNRDDKGVALEGIDAAFGSSNVKGKVDVRDAGRKSTWTVNLTSTSLDLEELTSSRATPATAKPAAPGAGTSHLVFSDAPVSFEALRGRDAHGEIAIDRLILSGGHKVERIRARFSLTDGKVDAPAVQAAGYGGTITGSVSVDATRGKPPAIALKLDGRELDLAALLAAAGLAREVRGGKTSVTIDVTMRGESPHQWMSGIGGRAQAVVGPATLVNTKLDPGLTFDRLAEAVNPFRAVKPSTELTCAVVRLPLVGGVAQVDRSIALETKEIDVSMSGTLDFRNETLDLSIRPRVRQGIPIEIPQIAELVRFTGPFAAPTVSVDAVASAAAIARVGAAIGTGGLSVLGETLLAGASSGAGACEVALGKGGTAAAAAPATSGASPNPIQGIGNALKGLFQR
jgi:uncharacterized protein involved in outer membrane biogenesis